MTTGLIIIITSITNATVAGTCLLIVCIILWQALAQLLQTQVLHACSRWRLLQKQINYQYQNWIMEINFGKLNVDFEFWLGKFILMISSPQPNW